MEEATFLTRFAKKVSVVHRRDKLRASPFMEERARNDPKIEFIWDSVITDIEDVEQGKVTAVKLKNVKTNAQTRMPIEGVFFAIGHDPNTEVFVSQVELDEKKYVVVKQGTATSVDGVFAAGDVADHRYKQAITAAGSGCMAALDSQRWLEAKR